MPYLGQRPSKGDENNFKILDDISSYTLTFDGSDSSVVSAANDTITSLTHRFVHGQRVTYNKGGGTVIAGLSDGVYYIIKEDHNTIKLATSASNATNGIAVNITGVGGGSSHTLNVAFDGINTKFKATHTNGQKAKITRSAQLVISINGVIQQPHDSATPSTGFGFDLDGTIVFSQAPVSSDVFWAHVLTNNNVTFDISDNDIDNFTGDGSTVSFNLSKTPPDNRNILVTVDGVVQYPNDPDGTVRSYNVVENVLTFAVAPPLDVQIQVRHIGFAGSTSGGSSGVTNFYGRTGSVVLTNSDNITVNDAAITGDATVTGNLTVNGTTTTLDTQLVEVDKIEVETAGTNVAVAVTHNGSGDLIRLHDGASQVVTVDDEGKVGIGSDIPGQKLDVGGTILTRSTFSNTATFSHNTLQFQTSGGAHIDHGTTDQNLNFRVTKSSTADTNMMQIDASAEQTKFHKQILIGLQGGGDTTVIGGGSGIGAYIQLNYANNNIVNTKLMGNNTSWLNSHYGNLGIGTQTADEKFQVQTGTHKFISFTDAEHSSLSDLGSAIIFSRPSNGAKKICGIFQHTNQSLAIAARDDLTFHTGGNAFYYSGSEALRITSAGRVGINTSDIGHLLTVVAQSTSSTIARFKAFNKNSNFDIHTDASSHGQAYVRNNIGAAKVQLNSNGVSYFTGGNVGIGTDNPLTELHVHGDTFTDITIHSERTSGNIGGINFRKGGVTSGIMTAQYIVDVDGSHYFYSQGSQRLKSASDGDLTITGSDNAELKLRVGTSTGNDIIAFLNSSGTTKGQIFYDTDDNFMVFKTNGTASSNERLRIDASGRVMIGTTTEGTVDSDDLTIATTGNTGMTIRSGTTSDGAIHFSRATSGVEEYAGYIDYDHNNNLFTMGTNSNRFLSADSDLVITLGKPSFGGASRVIVYGGAGGIDKNSLSVLNPTASVAGRGAGVAVGGNTDILGSFYAKKSGNADSAGGDVFLESVGAMSFITGGDLTNFISNTERLHITSAGDVLIGKTSGDHILDINASSDEIRLSKASASDYTGIQLDRDASGNAGGYFGLAGAANHYITGSAQHDICVRSEANLVFSAGGGTERFRIASDGDVTVTGTGDPVLTVTGSGHAQLTLTSTSGTDHCGVNFGDSSDHNAGMIQYTNSTNHMQFHTNGRETMRLDSNGSLKIYRSNSTASQMFSTLEHMESTPMREHVRYISAGASSATINLMRVRRHYWGAGFYKIWLKQVYYSATNEAVWWVNGHGRNTNGYSPTWNLGHEDKNGSIPSSVISHTTSSNSSPGNDYAQYIDIYATVSAYHHYVVHIEAMGSVVFSQNTSSVSDNGYALF